MKKNLSIVLICIILVFWFAGCKKKAAEEPRVETIDGVTYVHNPATPLHPDKTVVFEEEFTFREKDETGEIRLFKPGWFAVDATGNAYIADDSDMAIKVFDPQGKYLKSIGRKGSGPGEFERVRNMLFLPDGRLLVTDYEQRRTSFFSPEGQFLSSFQWKKFLSLVLLTTTSSCIVTENVFTGEVQELWVKAIDFSGEELFSFGKFTLPQFKQLRQGEITLYVTLPWSPVSIFAGDKKRQWLYHCLNDKYVIEVYDGQGKVFRKIDRPYEPVPVTAGDIQAVKSRYAERPDSPYAKLAEQMEFPKVKTVTDRLVVDSDGNLWVRTNEEKKEDEKTLRAYDIFNSDGFYEARAWLDIMPFLFAKGKMYRMAEDEETGFPLLKRYGIIWKER
ncbi:MAG: 6-bladed beta-propeller [Clostridiales bacterium]|nr:6-bladed beta-propeller [Clostridiales bacterium]